ncbi:MAG: methyltransferase domain-containing protein [Anaerolineales bacterium]|nr:methyltransferase domain-containing protein [Anaerolineales bacterium]
MNAERFSGRERKIRSQNYYDRFSRYYDLLAEPSEKSLRNAALKKINLKPGESFLDIGSGTGQALINMAQSLQPKAYNFGLDISEGMNQVAKGKLNETNLLERIFLVTGDAVNLPFQQSVFNAILMSFTLELFPTYEITRVLKECKRVLRYEAKICVVGLNQVENPGLAVRIYEYLHRQFSHLIDCRPIDISNSLQVAGFEVTDISRRQLWGLPVAIVVGVHKG